MTPPTPNFSPRPLSLYKLAKLVQPHWSDDTIKDIVEAFPDLNVYKLFQLYPHTCRRIGVLFEAALVIVHNKNPKGKKVVDLICDCRFDDRLKNIKNLKTFYLELGPELQLWHYNEMDMSRVLPLHVPNHIYRPLHELLEIDRTLPDPKNLSELEHFMETCGLSNKVQVNVSIVGVKFPKRSIGLATELNWGPRDPVKTFNVEARPGKNYDLIYRMTPTPKLKVEKVCQSEERETSPAEKPDNIFTKNRSCPIKLGRFGLNLAYDLGLLNLAELQDVSCRLGKTVAFFDAHHDTDNHLRILVYRDMFDGGDLVLAVDCEMKNDNDIATFFDQVEKRRHLLVTERKQILQPLFEKLNGKSAKGTKYHFCQRTLEDYIKKQKIFFYDGTDRFMHGFKFLFGKYAHKMSKNDLCRVPLVVGPFNDVLGLSTPNFCILNLSYYVNAEKDPLFRAAVEKKQVKLYHHWKKLKMEKYLEPSRPFLDLLLQVWSNFREIFMYYFSYDVFMNNSPSLAKLSFEAVEFKLCLLKGPLAQGKEKCKKMYQDLLTLNNRGGFTYSICDKLDSGQRLDEEEKGYKAKLICEYDVVSCYGYSSARHLLPDKFCVGFFTNPFLQSNFKNEPLTTPDHLLVKTDGSRWKSFEFRAAFFTLHKLMSSGRKIQSVYSNFSPLGPFQVGKHFLDLAVVFDDGSLSLWNFDSNYSHGCSQCPVLKRYINDNALHNLRWRATLRDSAINGWLKHCNFENSTYVVVTDCHHSDYLPANLKKAFRDVQELKGLSQSCPETNKLDTESLLNWLDRNAQSTDYTYLAWVRGCVEGNDRICPIALDPPPNKSTGHTLASSVGDRPLLVTRSYLEFLRRECQFKVSAVEAVLFFGTDDKANGLFQTLTLDRCNSEDPMVNDLLKKIVNFSVGFYGQSGLKSAPKFVLTNRFPKTSPHVSHRLESNHGVRDWNKLVLFVYKRNKVMVKQRYSGYFPFHITVIENGKLRLLEFLHLLQTYLEPGSFKLLYSNIDSCHLAFAETDVLKLIAPHKCHQFARLWAEFVSQDKIAGKFVIDWAFDDVCGFKYVTARTQNYAVLSGTFGKKKFSGINSYSEEECYHLSCKLLEHGVRILQQRRTDKINSLDTETKSLYFNPVEK